MASNQDVIDTINQVIEQINALIRRYSIPGILIILIGIGILLLALTYLPYIIGILVFALLAYLVYQRL